MKITSSSTAFITGGLKGIGLSIAESLLQRGARVWIVDLNGSELQALQSTLRQRYGQDRVYTSVCNVIDDVQLAKEFHAAVALFKHVHIVVNNAGFGDRDSFVAETSLKDEKLPQQWDDVLYVCLKSVINGTRLAVAHLLNIKASGAHSTASANELGVIINIASMGGLHPIPDSPIYCAAKHGVVGFSRSLKYLSSSGIRVNALCPSFVDTALTREGVKQNKNFKKFIEGFLDTLGPLLTVDQISTAAVLIIEGQYKGAVVSVSRELGIAQHYVVPNTPSEINKVIVPAERFGGNPIKAKL